MLSEGKAQKADMHAYAAADRRECTHARMHAPCNSRRMRYDSSFLARQLVVCLPLYDRSVHACVRAFMHVHMHACAYLFHSHRRARVRTLRYVRMQAIDRSADFAHLSKRC